MKQSEIKFQVKLDEQNVPEKIAWSATEKPDGGLADTNAIALSVWDNMQKNTLRIDLWTKEMTVDEMKRFCVDSIGGLAQTIESATGDHKMAQMMHDLCSKLVKHIENEKK